LSQLSLPANYSTCCGGSFIAGTLALMHEL